MFATLLFLAVQHPPAPIQAGRPLDGQAPPTRQPAASAPVERPQLEPGSKAHQPTDAERAEIAACIERLARVDSPDVGMSSTMSARGFAPLPDMATFAGGMLLTNHGVQPSADVAKLVAFGPKALPALLAALTDATATRFTFDRSESGFGGFGMTWYGHEIPVNPHSQREAAAVREFPAVFAAESSDSRGDSKVDESIESYTLTRGDVAFVVLGQIVNRDYQAMRYQPTACQVINSPVHDPAMAAALRKMWSSDDPARMLFESLWADLSGAPAEAADRSAALVRWLYDYPEAVTPFVVERLDRLAVSAAAVAAAGSANGTEAAEPLSAAEWCAAVSWSGDPRIVDALARVVERTDSSEIVDACLRAPLARAHPEVVVERCRALLARAPDRPRDPSGVAGSGDARAALIRGLVRFLPERAEPMCRTWLGYENPGCKFDVMSAAAQAGQALPWMIPMLRPLLKDATPTPWEYGPDYDRLRMRVCDFAASSLTRHAPGGRFDFVGAHADLDRQIDALTRRIDGATVDSSDEAPPRIEAIPQVQPILDVEVPAALGGVLPMSDDGSLFVTSGHHEDGWVLDVVTIDAKTGAVGATTRINRWHGGVNTVRPSPPDRIIAYLGADGGDLVVHDARTGAELARRASGFHDGVQFGDPKQVRGLGDLVGTSDGRYVFAWTCDSKLHTIDMTRDDRFEVATPAASNGMPPGFGFASLVSVEGTHRVLVSANDVLSVWDADARTLAKLERMPTGGWHAAWGRYACNSMNSDFQVFDLETRKRIPVRYPAGARVQNVIGDAAGARMFAQDASGAIHVVDLPSASVIAVLAAPASKSYASLTLSSDRKRLYRCEEIDERDEKTNTRSNPRTRILAFDVSPFTR